MTIKQAWEVWRFDPKWHKRFKRIWGREALR